MKITQKLSTTNTTAKSNRSIKYIVIHYTAGVTSAKNAALNTVRKCISKTKASYIQMDNSVILRLWNRDELIDEADFDVCNTPSMVQWILDYIE